MKSKAINLLTEDLPEKCPGFLLPFQQLQPLPSSAASLHFKRPCDLSIACAHSNYTDFLPPLNIFR
jgi:hypothetical protein